MPAPELEKLVLISIQDYETVELIRDFLEPLGYSVEVAPEAACFAASAAAAD